MGGLPLAVGVHAGPCEDVLHSLLLIGVEHEVLDVLAVEPMFLDDEAEHYRGALEVGNIVFG